MHKYQHILGKNIMFRDVPMIVAHVEDGVGITLQDPENEINRACVTPEYFGHNFKKAFDLMIKMVEEGEIDYPKMNELALRPIIIGLFSRTPHCPFE